MKPVHRPPLADRMRPRSFEEVVGQSAVAGADGVIPRLLAKGRPPSLILWGPPGCGKTTLARIIADTIGIPPVSISAVTSGVREVKSIVQEAQERIAGGGAPTLLFVDEIHRFNKAQQDAFLHPVEDGDIILIGATTENPSFELNAPLLSRCRVVPLAELRAVDLEVLMDRALADTERGLGEQRLEVTPEARAALLRAADGDARALLTDLEWLAVACAAEDVHTIDGELVTRVLSRRFPRYDKAGEEHYNIISALHKSVRGSDVQASLYWLARMLEGGEDPLYIARRLVRIASEDIGVADPQALPLAIAARDAVHFLGLPEGNLALAETVVYLATAPKSDRVYRGYEAAAEEVRRSGTLPVPLEVRNAPTRLMKELGYGAGYVSPHAAAAGLRVPFLPEELRGKRFYRPAEIGFEREIAKRMRYYEELRRRSKREPPTQPREEESDEASS